MKLIIYKGKQRIKLEARKANKFLGLMFSDKKDILLFEFSKLIEIPLSNFKIVNFIVGKNGKV